MKRPVLVHVRTQKGHGYAPAEREPWKFHGVGPFDAATGAVPSAKESFSSVFGAALTELAEEDPRVCAITAAMEDGTGLTPFAGRFPDRFFDVGIAEGHAAAMAAELLHGQGIEARVVKLNRISPFRGGELSRIFGTTKRLLVAEECSGVGCIGQRIAAILAEEGHEPQRLMLCNLGRRFIEQGSVGELYRQCGLDAESLARTAKEVCQ